jgi:aromatic ring-opening dioxygenase LigB subunit
MPLVYACITPHGGETIPGLAKSKTEDLLFRKTRNGLRAISRRLAHHHPDTIVIASPHNLRLHGKIGVVFSEHSSGSLRGESDGKEIKLSANCDTKLAKEIYSKAIDRSMPVVGANYGSFEGPTSDMPMDWGTLVPLWFFMRKKMKPKIVIVTPSREIPIAQNYAFGAILAELSKKSRKRIAFVASADQAHAHDRVGPYGFHVAAEKYDQIVINALKSNELKSLLRLDPRFIEDAKPDSFWQIAMLAGCVSKTNLRPRFISYDVPTYYGMICADFSAT